MYQGVPSYKHLDEETENFQEKVNPSKCRVQSRVSWNSQLHMVKAWRFPARMHSKTNLPSTRGC